MSSTPLLHGIIVRAQSGFFGVQTDRGLIVAKLRGRLTQGLRTTDAAAVGDRVQVRLLEDGSGAIEAVEPRARVLSRKAPGQRREVEQVIVANPDQAVLVFACADPDPNFRMLDRFLVVAEREQIPALLCVNKVDLVERRSAKRAFADYERLGYDVIFTSAKTGRGVGELRGRMRRRLSVLAGPSGVGKSSLLNAIQPGLGLRVREVARATGRGRHATVVPELVPLEGGGYVADTPGLRALDLWDIEPQELDAYFRELRPLVEHCDFSDCSHVHEPGCAVIEAVEKGEVSEQRYESYLRMRLGEE
ncbi:MAG TPA: ribosome small subunit-dependent GTPase A [Anaerolineales bacterium]|nr:ribosome small subunit-dependent GTPase A [Anaerolineales bacterium]